MATKKNYTVDEKKGMIYINKIPLSADEEKEVDQMQKYYGYTIGKRPKRKASPFAKLTKDNIKELVKGSKEAEAEFNKLSDAKTPIMSLKKALKQKYPELFSDEAIAKIIK